MMREQRLIRCYMMILGGFEIDKDIAKQIDCIEILLVIREGVKIELLK